MAFLGARFEVIGGGGESCVSVVLNLEKLASAAIKFGNDEYRVITACAAILKRNPINALRYITSR